MTDQVPDDYIVARNIEMRFASAPAVLNDVFFTIGEGEFVSLIGPSGCGKSTLLRLLAGLTVSTGGELTVAGVAPEVARRERHNVAFVFQDANLLPWRNVEENVRLPLELQRSANARQDALIRDRLRLVGLTDADAAKRPHMLSGGMKMRVSLARALVTKPDLLLLDEPFAALDDLMRQQLNDDVSRIWQTERSTAVFVTHNVAEAVYLSQRIFVMNRSPAKIAHQVDVPFPFPRSQQLRSTAEFAELTGRVMNLLHEVGA